MAKCLGQHWVKFRVVWGESSGDFLVVIEKCISHLPV